MSTKQATPSSADGTPTHAGIDYRLALSRERLRQALRDIVAPPGVARSQRASESAMVWLDALKSNPSAGIVIEAVSSWWAQHPLRFAGLIVADAVKTAVHPIAQRSPLALILGAAVVGGLLLRLRPWRWIPKSVLLAGLLPQLLSKAMGQVRPLSWLALLRTLAQQLNRPGTPKREEK